MVRSFRIPCIEAINKQKNGRIFFSFDLSHIFPIFGYSTQLCCHAIAAGRIQEQISWWCFDEAYRVVDKVHSISYILEHAPVGHEEVAMVITF